MTSNNSKKYNAHARKPSYTVLDLREDMSDNYKTAERIRQRELVDLFAPEFESEIENKKCEREDLNLRRH